MDYEFVTATVRKYLKDDPAVEDVVQNALLSAFTHRNAFQGRSRRTTWLYRIAANAALMHLRSLRRKSALLVADAVDVATVEVVLERSPEQEVAERETLTRTAQQVTQLGRRYRKVVELRAIGFTDDEVADKLRLPPSTVKTRFYRARRQLRYSNERKRPVR